MIDLGTVKPGSTIRIPFSTFDKDDGSSITMTGYAVADILVYKDGSTTERASTAGYTATTDFDVKTGKQLAVIDLSDNTTANFWAAGSEYLVAIDAVTVDAVTTGGWIARFRIGYSGAVLDTTIATLASQTSFTLTTGPAEDDALNGMWAVIHDIASAVQAAWVLVSDYTGSTKTVTLATGATFTVAAGDNISIMFPAPLQPTTAGRTLDVSSAGEAGLDWANIGSPTTAQNLSGTSTKALEPTTAGRTLDVTATGEAGIDWANVGSPTTAQNLSSTSTKAIEPTVAGRTLDVSVGGEAGVDWANVGTPGSAINLSATTVNSVNTVTNRVDCNVQYVNNVQVGGTGASGNEWGPA